MKTKPISRKGEPYRNTLSLKAFERGPNVFRGLVRKVSVGTIGGDAEIVWEYKTGDAWLPAANEAEAIALAKKL